MKIEVLKEIAQDVTLADIQLKGRSLELFKLLKKKPGIENREVIELWYGDDPIGSNYLWKIKQKLFHELVDHYLSHIPTGFDREIQQNYHYCHRINAVANILLGQFKRKAAVLLAQEGLKRAQKHQFTAITVSLSTLLYRHYGVFVGDRKKATHFKLILNQALEVQTLELKAESHYIELVSSFPKSKKASPELLQLGAESLAELEPLIGQVPSSRFHLITFNLMVALQKIKGDQEGIVKACESAVAYFDQRQDTRSGIRFIFHYNQIPPLIALGRFEKLEGPMKVCLELSPKVSYNWVTIHQYKAIACFYQEDFESAYNILISAKKEATKHSSLQEMWLILEAYANLFTGRKYRLQKFMNEVPVYSKDKRGMNINILLIQILSLLQKEQYGKLIDKTKALEHYTSRYLYEDANLRSNCLIKSVLTAEKCGFRKSMVEKRAAELLEKMSAAPIRDIDMEPVRYEVLWGKIQGYLK